MRIGAWSDLQQCELWLKDLAKIFKIFGIIWKNRQIHIHVKYGMCRVSLEDLKHLDFLFAIIILIMR